MLIHRHDIASIHATTGPKGAAPPLAISICIICRRGGKPLFDANGGGDATTASFITNVTLVSIYPSSPPPLRQISYHSAIEQKAVEIERGDRDGCYICF